MASNKSVASGRCGSLQLNLNGATGVSLYSEAANTFDLSISSDEFYAKASGSDKTKFLSNAKAKTSITFEIFTLKMLAVMFNMTSTTGVSELFANDVFDSPTTTLTLSDIPKAGSLTVAKMEIGDNQAFLDEGEIDSGDATNAGEYSISGQEITLNSADLTNPIRVFYLKDSASTAITYKFRAADVASIGYTMSFVTDMTDANNGAEVPSYIVAKNAQPSANTSISFSAGSAASITMDLDLLPDDLGDNFSITQI